MNFCVNYYMRSVLARSTCIVYSSLCPYSFPSATIYMLRRQFHHSHTRTHAHTDVCVCRRYGVDLHWVSLTKTHNIKYLHSLYFVASRCVSFEQFQCSQWQNRKWIIKIAFFLWLHKIHAGSIVHTEWQQWKKQQLHLIITVLRGMFVWFCFVFVVWHMNSSQTH